MDRLTVTMWATVAAQAVLCVVKVIIRISHARLSVQDTLDIVNYLCGTGRNVVCLFWLIPRCPLARP